MIDIDLQICYSKLMSNKEVTACVQVDGSPEENVSYHESAEMRKAI